MNPSIGVLGGGSWGTALSVLLASKNYNVDIWLRDENQIKEIIQHGENRRYLPGVKFSKKIDIYNDLEKVIYNKDIILLSIPTHGIREVLNMSKRFIKDNQVIVNVAKGIENESLLRISEIVNQILPNNKYAVLSGPSHAEEVGINIPTTIVSASKDKDVAEYIQDTFFTPSFRVYTNPDIIGVELSGALKNVIALGAGISDGLKYGDNTKAALMTRGIFEMARLGEEMGAKSDTFFGLAGIGDLIVTCTSMHSRNRRAGILIGKGMKLDEAIKEVGMVVEGIRTTKSTYKLAEKFNISMPITEEIYKVLYEDYNVEESVPNLMLREKKIEIKGIFFDENIKW